ncbi:hypothetical protein TrVFT333_009861 [Trichoderma virens FT-333]|nr:hypothetical protein TrVFT333_009861 [Trichoderma virens FT-333]
MGQFDWFKKIGATDEAVAVLNDQPYLFTTLVVVIVVLLAEGGLLYFIHWATFKPSQKKAPKKGGAAKPSGGGLLSKITQGEAPTTLAAQPVAAKGLVTIISGLFHTFIRPYS